MLQQIGVALSGRRRLSGVAGAVAVAVGSMWLNPALDGAQAYVTSINLANVTNGTTTISVPVEYNPADNTTATFNPPQSLTPAAAGFSPFTGNYDYLPNVVNQENGTDSNTGASTNTLAAYEAQAIAARSFLYYQQPANGGTITDSTANQVYSSSTNPFAPTTLEETAVQMTQGIILQYNPNVNASSPSEAGGTIAENKTSGDTIVDGFFVAGDTVTTSDTPFGQPPADPTSPNFQYQVTYNRGLTGSNITVSNLSGDPVIANTQDRGALSQNGIDFLTANPDPSTGIAFNYSDALRYFYGADIHLAVASPTSSATEMQAPVPLEAFTTDNGYFANADRANGQMGTVNNTIDTNITVASDTMTHTSDSHSGSPNLGSQQLTITGDGGGAFNYFDVAGLGPNSVQTNAAGEPISADAVALVGTSAANISVPAIGTITYWIKATNGILSTDLLLNDGTTGDTIAGLAPEVVTDNGQFEEFTFPLNDTEFPGLTTGLDSDVSINAIEFMGAGTASLELDDVEYNETGTAVPEPAALAILPAVGLLLRRRRNRG